MSISNILKYSFYTIAVLYSIYLVSGIIIIARILFNDKKIPINTPTNIVKENNSNIYIETTQMQLINGKITIISLIIIAFLVLSYLTFVYKDGVFLAIQILISIVK